jgi:hypothetical protein
MKRNATIPVVSGRQKSTATFNQIDIQDQGSLRWVVQRSDSEAGTEFLVTIKGGKVVLKTAVPIWVRSFSVILILGEGGKSKKSLSPGKWGAVRPEQEISLDGEEGFVLFDALTYAPPGTFPKPPPPPPPSEKVVLVSQPLESGLGVSFSLSMR